MHAADHMALFKRATAYLALHKLTEAINDLSEAINVRRALSRTHTHTRTLRTRQLRCVVAATVAARTHHSRPCMPHSVVLCAAGGALCAPNDCLLCV